MSRSTSGKHTNETKDTFREKLESVLKRVDKGEIDFSNRSWTCVDETTGRRWDVTIHQLISEK